MNLHLQYEMPLPLHIIFTTLFLDKTHKTEEPAVFIDSNLIAKCN
jgi:hypothetical protein